MNSLTQIEKNLLTKTINSYKQPPVVICDISGSMNEVGSCEKTRFELLNEQLEKIPNLPSATLVSFAYTPQICTLPLPTPRGSTNLIDALALVTSLNPQFAILISDGIPDDCPPLPTFPVHTIFVGDPMDDKAVEFMTWLAHATGGKNLIDDFRLLGEKITGLLA